MAYGIMFTPIFLAQVSCAEARDFIPTAIFVAVVVGVVLIVRTLKHWRARNARIPDGSAEIKQDTLLEPNRLEPIVNIQEMPSDICESITAKMRGSDNETLHKIFAFNRADYQPEALVIARNELARRGLSVLSPEEYWQQYAENGIDPSGFCQKCFDQTTAESPSESDRLTTLFLFHYRLWGKTDQCEICRSVVTRYWLWFSWWLPLYPSMSHPPRDTSIRLQPDLNLVE